MPAPPLESEPAMVTAIGGHRALAPPAPRRRRARSSRAAALGSGASDSAEITATPSAPAAMTSAALLASMPAMPQVGRSAFARAERRDDAREAGNADRRIGIVLRGRGEDAADADIVEQIDRRGLRLRDGLDRSPMIASGPSSRRASCDRHVVLADMHAVGARRERDVDAVVDQERHAERRQRRLDGARALDHGARRRRACRATARASRRLRASSRASSARSRPPERSGSTMA